MPDLLLALVVVGLSIALIIIGAIVGVLFSRYLKRGDREQQQDEFMRAMLDRDYHTRQEDLEQWRQMLQEMIVAQQAQTEVLGKMCDGQDEHARQACEQYARAERRARERHEAQMAALER